MNEEKDILDEYKDEEPDDRAVSRKDQLHYRVVIQRIVERCLITMGTWSFSRHVKALRYAMYFTVPGLPFKRLIDQAEENLEKKKAELTESEHERLGRYFYKNANQAKFKIKMQGWYWETLFNQLTDILSEHNALWESKGYVEEGTGSYKGEEEKTDIETPYS